MRVFKFTLLSLCVFLFCSRTYAYDCEVDGFYYNRISSTEFELTNGENKYSGDISIPENVMYNGRDFTVTRIGTNAFIDCYLTSLVIPKSINSILSNSFCYDGYPSAKIDRIVISDIASWCNVTLSDIPFKVSDSIFYNGKEIDDLILPDGISTIKRYTFCNCKTLKTLSIPKGVESIEKWAFGYCPALTSVSLQDGLKSLNGFTECTSLTTIAIPEGVTTIGESCFARCTSLQSIILPNTLTRIYQDAFRGCSSLSNIIIPKSVTYISSAFSGCTSLTSIEIPDGVKEIEQGMFYQCSSLSSCNIPNSVEKIESYAFSGCSSLSEITIPNNITTIYDNTFDGCSGLKKIVIGKNVGWIYDGAFKGCTSLSSIFLLNPQPPVADMKKYYAGGYERGQYGKSFDDDIYIWTDLYIPNGSKEDYLNESIHHNGDSYSVTYRNVWQNFRSITEFDPDTLETNLHSFTISSSKGGKVIYQEEEISSETKTFYVSPNKSASFYLVADKGYQLSAVYLNDNNITTTINNNVLYLDNLSSVVSLIVVFKEIPIFLTIQCANSGNIKQNVENGKSYSFQIEPADGWKINSVLYNGQDVTNQLTDDGFFTTPAIAENSTLNVSFESTAESSVRQAYFNDLKVYANGNTIYIKGIKQGETVSVYDLGGSMIKSIVSKCDSIEIPLPSDQVYIVRTTDKVFKVGL